MINPKNVKMRPQQAPQAPQPVRPRQVAEDRTLYQEELSEDDEMMTEVSMRRATVEQEYAAKLFNERKVRMEMMQRISALELENTQLRTDLAKMRISQIQVESKQIELANAKMFADAGLSDGDQLQQTEQGLFVIPKSE